MAALGKLKKALGRKIPPVVRPDADGVTYRPLNPLQERINAWRPVLTNERRRAMYDRAAQSVDHVAYAALQEKYRDEVLASDELAVTKYLDLAPWFMIHSRLAMLLDIDTRPKCSILDIGSGGGQFLAIAKSYGHDVLAFDMPNPAVYGDLMTLFGIDRVEGGVMLGEALPKEIGRFDLIVINGQVFDVRPPNRERWEVAEWTALIEYLCDQHLNYPGQLFIGLNRSAGPTGKEEYLWPLVDVAERHGATVERDRATMNFTLDMPPSFDDVEHRNWPDYKVV